MPNKFIDINGRIGMMLKDGKTNVSYGDNSFFAMSESVEIETVFLFVHLFNNDFLDGVSIRVGLEGKFYCFVGFRTY